MLAASPSGFCAFSRRIRFKAVFLNPCLPARFQADPEITPLGEGAGLLLGSGGGSSVGAGGLPPLPDGPSSEFDDGVSLSSAATASTAGGAGDAGTALLRAAFLKDEYRGEGAS